MASRTLYSHLSDPPPTGLQFLEQYADRLRQLFTAAVWPLSSVGGTGNAVTATCNPPLLAGLITGMRFSIIWAAANTGGVTLAIDGGAAVPVLGPDGTALNDGDLGTGLMGLLEYDGSDFRVLSPLLMSLGGGSARYYWQLTASGTFTKPTGLDDDTMVHIESWGAGSGGASTALNSGGTGGRGGGYVKAQFRAADLPSTVSYAIGAGGAVGAAGGNTTFGSLVTAPGGVIGVVTTIPCDENGGAPGSSGVGLPNPVAAGTGGRTLRAGAGGGGQRAASGSVTNGVGGESTYGGDGGAGGGPGAGGAGQAPGGAGGANGVGARGEIRVWI